MDLQKRFSSALGFVLFFLACPNLLVFTGGVLRMHAAHVPAGAQRPKGANPATQQAAVEAIRRSLIQGVRNKDPRPFEEIARAGPKIVPTIASLLTDREVDVRVGAAQALGFMGPKAREAVPALITALKDDVPLVRGLAARSLGAIGPDARTAVPALISALKDGEAGVRRASAGALRDLGSDARMAVPALKDLLESSTADTDSIVVVASALEGIGPEAETAAPALPHSSNIKMYAFG